MKYCLSDVHGEYNRFLNMLKKISFSDEDELFILGDVIDRGEDGVKLLQHIKGTPNMHMLMGNHEDMMIGSMVYRSSRHTDMWMWNYGAVTKLALLDLATEERDDLLDWASNLPDAMSVNVNGQEFFLVHAWPGATHKEKIWSRPLDHPHKIVKPDGAQVIIGHTPTVLLDWDDGESPFKIVKHKNYIAIDCGCGHIDNPRRRLGCLRLDDMSEFYT